MEHISSFYLRNFDHNLILGFLTVKLSPKLCKAFLYTYTNLLRLPNLFVLHQTLFAVSCRAWHYHTIDNYQLRVCTTLLVVFLLYTDKLQKPVGRISSHISRFTPSLAPLQRSCAESNGKVLHRQHIYHTLYKYYPYNIVMLNTIFHTFILELESRNTMLQLIFNTSYLFWIYF